jgi:DNA repair protein RecO (recombination protein O)
MAAEKATALVLRTIDWSETSRIATLWTREFGKVRVLAKGGRRLKSNFDSALDLLTVCSIVFLRKSSGGLDLLTEAQVTERFGRLRNDLPALYAGYYVAELLADWTEDYDPHPCLFDEALAALRAFGSSTSAVEGTITALRLARFEIAMLRELGYGPALDACAVCGNPVDGDRSFSAVAGGVVCRDCRGKQRDRRNLSPEAWELLRALSRVGEPWQRAWGRAARTEVRQVLGQYVTTLRGRPPRLLPYLGS